MNFGKMPRGGGHFQSKNYVADFGNFKQGFLIMKLIQKSNFGVQGMFFQQLYWENQNKTHLEEGSSNHNSLRDGSRYQIGWIFGKVPNGSWPPPLTPQNGPYLWKSCACISYYLAIIPPCIYATISIINKLQYNFLKMRGGVKGRLEFFRKFIRFGCRTLP